MLRRKLEKAKSVDAKLAKGKRGKAKRDKYVQLEEPNFF
jgi:hypothetical protein